MWHCAFQTFYTSSDKTLQQLMTPQAVLSFLHDSSREDIEMYLYLRNLQECAAELASVAF